MPSHRRGPILRCQQPDGFEAVTPAWSTRLCLLSRCERRDSFLQPPSRFPLIGVIAENGCYCKRFVLTWTEEQSEVKAIEIVRPSRRSAGTSNRRFA
jgi:hypothetical protein